MFPFGEKKQWQQGWLRFDMMSNRIYMELETFGSLVASSLRSDTTVGFLSPHSSSDSLSNLHLECIINQTLNLL